MTAPGPPRLSPERLRSHLASAPAPARAAARALRAVVLNAAPHAAEAVRFGCLAYFDPGARFGSIGGNICLIETRRGVATLSFIHGAALPDPGRVLRGTAKAKRSVPVRSAAEAGRPVLRALVRASARLAGASPRKARAL